MVYCHLNFQATTFSDVGVLAQTRNLVIEKKKDTMKEKEKIKMTELKKFERGN